ncbi:hypothetical protein LCGC14_0323590 [marine sediment metagenome]|uniref:Uncharacterized protein n=1 Tax=marine sediment metagenome TaxID=412755 RepID=A0A0F9TIP3_9ZZZZ
MKDALRNPSKWQRGPTAHGFENLKSNVVRSGGDSGAGLISRFSVITRGEALGHEMWIDRDFLQQTADAINANGRQGIKSRFTHPGLSGDGLGRFLGRVKDARVIGTQTFADLHISETAHDTPDGDLGSFVMDLAEKEPDMFGTSIVFSRSESDEAAFIADHKDKRGRFVSPDRNNAQNFVHARLQELRADDVVDEPAANPHGMFHRGDEIARDAEDLLCYSLGLTETVPSLTELDIDPTRVAEYLKKFLARRGLRIVSASDLLARCEAARE